MVDFKPATKDAFESAKANEKPIVIWFAAKDAKDIQDKELAAMVNDSKIVCVRVNKMNLDEIFGSDKKDEKVAKPVVPVCKIEQLDLWKAYGAEKEVKEGTFVVADWFGNEYFRCTNTPSAYVNKLNKKIESTIKDINKDCEKALEAHEKGDLKAAVKNVLDIFKQDMIGYQAVTKATELYQKLLEAGRAKVTEAGADEKALKELATTFKGTDLTKEIEEALGNAKVAK